MRSLLVVTASFAMLQVGADTMNSELPVGGGSSKFSFGEPLTFQYGSADQKRTLREIGEAEFSLAHLEIEHRALVEEALRNSGIEVQSTCAIDMEIQGELGAFFRKYAQHEQKRFDPDKGVLNLPTDKEKEDGAPTPTWQGGLDEYTEYPYPLGDAAVLPKVIPVDLSSIALLSESDDRTRFEARPSALLMSKLLPKDRLFGPEDLVVEFAVNRETRRIETLTLRTKKAKRVYFGIKITALNIEYEFEDDARVGRNVLKRVNHSMRGRIGGVFRPNFNLTTELEYERCESTPQDSSYLYASVDSINAL